VSELKIPIEEIEFHPTSFCDRDGRVFWWRGDLYRGIAKESVDFYQRLFENGIVQRLIEKKFLIETELTDMSLNGYPLVLKHRRVPFVSYANEWCPEMLKDAALLVIDMIMELASDRLILDVGTWDMLFDGCRPVFVDFCSIVAADSYGNESWARAEDDFRSYFLYPLWLMAQGYGNLARWLLADFEHKVIHAEFAALMGVQIYNFQACNAPKSLLKIAADSIPRLVHPLARKGLKSIKSSLPKLTRKHELRGRDLARQLQQELETIPAPSAQKGQTDKDDDWLPFTPSKGWAQKHLSVHAVLSDLRPATVLDIGCNRGWYSQLAALLGSRVVALDIDEKHVTHCYREARENNLTILPLVMDIRFPSPGQGACNQVIAPALQRFPCDMVLALSLVHHLVLDQHLTFEQVSDSFAAFSKRWLLVEFPSSKAPEVRERWSDWHSWYTLKNFINALMKRFRSVRVMENQTKSHVLLLCEK
jgi:SAM-dependent methyltransferase